MITVLDAPSTGIGLKNQTASSREIFNQHDTYENHSSHQNKNRENLYHKPAAVSRGIFPGPLSLLDRDIKFVKNIHSAICIPVYPS